MNKVDKAITFAAKKHANQKRKGFNQSYMYHPLEVLSLVTLLTDDEDVWCGALLHDTVEDTDTTIEEVRSEFGDRVADMVADESEDKRGNVNKADTWVDRKKEAIDHIKSITNTGSKMICLCDKVSNLRSMQLLQFDKGDHFLDAFNMKDPKMHYWYYNELKDALSELKDYAIYKEFAFLIDAVFGRYL